MPDTAMRQVLAPSIPRGGIGIGGFYLAHFLGAALPTTAGLALYGWHAVAVLVGVSASAAISMAIWRRIGARGRTLHWSHGLWYALVLGLMLPAELAMDHLNGGPSLWPLVAIAGLLLVILLWLLGGLGGWYAHPVLITYLLLVGGFPHALVEHRILNRDHLLTGELLRTGEGGERTMLNEPWVGRPRNRTDADYYQEPSAGRLARYTSGRETPARQWMPLFALLRDSLPFLEDFIVGGQPGGIGTSSVVAVIVGGLFLLYRGMVDARIPLLTCLAAYASLLILPIPSVISTGPQWHWLAFRQPDIGWSVAITFANYEVMASPLIFMAFFLASAPIVRPMTRRGRTIYALLLGILAAVFQLYVSVSFGPYLALLIVGILTPELDRWFKVRPMF